MDELWEKLINSHPPVTGWFKPERFNQKTTGGKEFKINASKKKSRHHMQTL
jgi:hypothetical protein